MSKHPSKISVILESVKDSKAKYIKIVNPNDGKDIMFLKLVLDFDEYEDYLDAFFDEGLKVASSTQDEFDNFQSDDVMGYKID